VARFGGNVHVGFLLLAIAIAFVLWTVAHGTSPVEVVFDVPIEVHGLNEELVIVGQSVDAVNIRVAGSRAALNNVTPGRLSYPVDLQGSKDGETDHEVNLAKLDLPVGARAVSHSPSRLQFRLEDRGRKSVSVRVDLEGEPASGFQVGSVAVEPKRVWLSGARSQVLRLSEIVTQPMDISGITETREQEVPLLLGGSNVWLEENAPVKVVVGVEPEPAPEEASETEDGVKSTTLEERPS